MSYIDCNDKAQRIAVRGAVGIAVTKMHKLDLQTTEINVGLLENIEAVLERQEEIIEDLEERIAIMTEGDPG